jgi:undecaprenyl-phosphate 4-deoxy-4-formamido-L-arabinose transferase
MNLSVVIPVYNSSTIISKLINNLSEEILKIKKIASYQIILVNDYSDDSSWDEITKICNNEKFVVGINLMKNYGQHNALMAGINIADGNYIITMDDDFQHSPKEISKLLDKIEEGYDVCYTNYQNNKYSTFKVFSSRLSNKISNFLINKPNDIYLSSFKCFTKKIAEEIKKYDGPFVYIDGLIFNITSNVSSVNVEHLDRMTGTTNYNIFKLISLWLRVLTNFSIVPLRVSTITGFFMTFISFCAIILIIIIKLMNPTIAAGWASIISVLLFFSGLQFIVLGLIGEYIGRSYLNINKKPQFVVREYKNLKEYNEK